MCAATSLTPRCVNAGTATTAVGLLGTDDIVRTPGSESNVKEIYDTFAGPDARPENVIFNQFCEFGNHLAHVTSIRGKTAPPFPLHFEFLMHMAKDLYKVIVHLDPAVERLL